MKASGNVRLHRRLQISGILLAAGLAIQLTTLYWTHPLAFVLFIVLGGVLASVGVLMYLVAIVSP